MKDARLRQDALDLLAYIEDTKASLLRIVINTGEDNYVMAKKYERVIKYLKLKGQNESHTDK